MAPPKNVADVVSGLLESGAHSDLTLVCQGIEFRVHQAIVCPQSPVIKNAVCGGFKESDTKILDVNFDVSALRSMLDFMYRGFYDLGIKDMQPSGASIDRTRNCIEQDLSVLKEKKALRGKLLKKDRIRLEELEKRLEDMEYGIPTPIHALDAHTRVDGIADPTPVLALDDHIRVNGIADYYDVPLLLDMSRQNIRSHLMGHWSPEKFTTVCQTVLGENVTGDVLLIRMLGKLAAEHSRQLPQPAVLSPLVNSDFWLGFQENIHLIWELA